MILRRLGNKQHIAEKIIKYFPQHKYYVEPFFGSGGMFFNKPKSPFNVVNDLDSDVSNLFHVSVRQKDDLLKAVHDMPIHQDLLNYWKVNQEIDPILKAIRFIFLSNFTLLGAGTNMRHSISSGAGGGKNYKDNFPLLLQQTFDMLYDVNFSNSDFEVFLSTLSFQKDGRNDEEKTFIYCDAPYLDTADNYSNSFTEADSLRLFNVLEAMGCKWAMSEFDHPFILEQAKQRGLNVHIIGERQNMKNRRTEILVTNYADTQLKLF